MAIMSVEQDTRERDAGRVLAGVRRLTVLGDAADDTGAVFRGLSRELFAVLGAEEVHVHHFARMGGQELVVVYLLDGDGRLSYIRPREEREPGVGWVASSGRSFLAVGPRELTASVPRLLVTSPPPKDSLGCALLAPLSIGGQVEAVVVLVRRMGAPFGEAAIEQAATLIQQAAVALALVRARAEAGTDSVVGCMNHRAMRRRLHEEIGRASRTDGLLSCAIVDLDDFKLVNDVYGHQAGDAILREVAHTLMGEFRSFDRVARYGGDEFVVILPNADIDSALVAADRALARLGEVSFPDGRTSVSASMGVAQWHAPMTADDLLGLCDAALLKGKRDGKGAVTGAMARAWTQPAASRR